MQKDASEKAKDQMKEDILAQQLEQTTEPTHAPETMSFEWKSTFKSKNSWNFVYIQTTQCTDLHSIWRKMSAGVFVFDVINFSFIKSFDKFIWWLAS